MKRELVVQLTRFGDLIQTKRLVLSLQRQGSEVHLMIDRSLKKLAGLVYPDVVIHSIISHGSGISAADTWRVLIENRKTFDKVSGINFDRVYNLNFSTMNYAVSALFNPAKVVGYRLENGQELKSPWIELAFRFSANRRCGINLVDYWAAFADKMIAPQDVNPVPEAKGGGIGVVLSGRESRRSLPINVLVPIIGAARSSAANKKVFLLGSNAEKESGAKLKQALPKSFSGDVINLAGKTDWADLYEIISGLDRILTPDTGTMHLAAHLGIPVTAFFLSSAWVTETGPYGEGHRILQTSVPCAPCLESVPCPNKIVCLDAFKSGQTSRYAATGKPSHLSENMFLFESGFDALGVSFNLLRGADPYAEERRRMRDFLAAHLGLTDPAQHGPFFDIAERYYRDKDWITFNRKS